MLKLRLPLVLGLLFALVFTASCNPFEGDDEDGDAEPATPTAAPQEGAVIFAEVCAACHQPDGQGVEGVYPALADSPFVAAQDPAPVIEVVLTGRGGMPRFGDSYSSQEIANVVTFIRTSLSNEASEVDAAEVDGVRDQLQSESEESTGESGD